MPISTIREYHKSPSFFTIHLSFIPCTESHLPCNLSRQLPTQFLTMHSTSFTAAASAASVCASTKAATTITTTISAQQEASETSSCVNHSSPQCCHCGWRGSHSPNCPFK
ncbi:hypothetical protein B0H34DRAFT_680875 [Crassisporium funariophilum]|nr:hypothetical protein B0H34DRAFT_680875 [Crassisporium funariophilum]